MFRLAGELLSQHRILGRDTYRAGVEVTLAHHDAPERNQRRGGKAHFLSAEQGRNDNVASGLKAAVRLQHDAAAQVVHAPVSDVFLRCQAPTAGRRA